MLARFSFFEGNRLRSNGGTVEFRRRLSPNSSVAEEAAFTTRRVFARHGFLTGPRIGERQPVSHAFA